MPMSSRWDYYASHKRKIDGLRRRCVFYPILKLSLRGTFDPQLVHIAPETSLPFRFVSVGLKSVTKGAFSAYQTDFQCSNRSSS